MKRQLRAPHKRSAEVNARPNRWRGHAPASRKALGPKANRSAAKARPRVLPEPTESPSLGLARVGRDELQLERALP
jgi:hypothetical protein